MPLPGRPRRKPGQPLTQHPPCLATSDLVPTPAWAPSYTHWSPLAVFSRALHPSFPEMSFFVMYSSRSHDPLATLPDNEGTENWSYFPGVPYTFSGLWVIQLTPLLTGVSAVPAVLRVLWREDGRGSQWSCECLVVTSGHPSHLLPLLFPIISLNLLLLLPCWLREHRAVKSSGEDPALS